MVADFGVEGVDEEAPEGGEAEEALVQGGRSQLSHTDMKVCITTVNDPFILYNLSKSVY